MRRSGMRYSQGTEILKYLFCQIITVEMIKFFSSSPPTSFIKVRSETYMIYDQATCVDQPYQCYQATGTKIDLAIIKANHGRMICSEACETKTRQDG